MKVLVFGCEGQVGYAVMNELSKRGYEAIGTDNLEYSNCFNSYYKCDITVQRDVEELILKINPDAIIHCAAWTQVDKAEQNQELVYKINALGPKYISEASAKIGAKVLYISTDYVFDGKGNEPFEVDSKKNGLSTYGRTKSDGEDFVLATNKKHFIVRSSGIFGMNGHNFVKTMISLAKSGKKEIYVVNDQIVSVTYANDLAILLVDMIETEKYGIYHATNQGYLSWCDFSREIFKEIDADVIVHGVSSEEYKKMVVGQTERPKNSRLSYKSLDEAGFNRLPHYKDALNRFLKEMENN